MNLFDRLKQLKLIQPDPAFSERSKRDVLSTPATLPFQRLTVRQYLFRFLEASVAGALVALFIFVMTGGVANSPLVPAPFAAVNPSALHAEAQAIDIQIKLAGLAYEAAAKGTGIATDSTPMGIAAKMMVAETSTSLASATTTSTTTPVSVDEALKALSQ